MQLKDYIQGNRRGKEANKLEREAMNDPFLQGAIDGFDSVAGDHAKIIEQLEEKYSRPSVALKSKNKTLFYWAAASVLLIIGFGVYYFFFDEDRVEINYRTSRVAEESSKLSSMDSSLSETRSDSLIAGITHDSVNSATSPATTDNVSNLSKEYVFARDTTSSPEQSKEQVAQTTMNQVEIAKAEEKMSISEEAKEKKVATFGEKEFQTWCKQRVSKDIYDSNGSSSVEISFFVNESGKPSYLEFKKYSSEEAKEEIGKIFFSSPLWTETNRKVTMTVRW